MKISTTTWKIIIAIWVIVGIVCFSRDNYAAAWNAGCCVWACITCLCYSDKINKLRGFA